MKGIKEHYIVHGYDGRRKVYIRKDSFSMARRLAGKIVKEASREQRKAKIKISHVKVLHKHTYET